MATYDEIYGKRVDVLSSDPTLSSANEGQVWYNSTTGTLKTVVSFGAWSSTSPLATSRSAIAAAGIQTAGLWFGGEAPAVSNATEEYNGSGFSAGGNLNTARYYLVGAGTQTAGLAAGGATPPATNATEEYNGSAWSTVPGTLPTPANQSMGGGTQTAAFYAGGSSEITAGYEYDGTNWTAGGSLNSGRANGMGAGTLAAGLVGFGYRSPFSNQNSTEEYDGTSWTTVNAGNTARRNVGGWGLQTSAICAGGYTTTSVTTTEEYDGTNWTATASLGSATAIGAGGAAGASIPGGLAASTTAAEEFNKSINTITAAAWASGGNLNTARYSLGGFGTATAGVAMCGRDSPIYQATEEYDGSSWTTVNNYPQTVVDLGSTGVLTAGLGLGGLDPPSIPSFPTTGRVTGEYDGTNWTTGGSYTYDAWGTGCAGTQTATVASGGHNYPMPPGNISSSAEYDGSSWTAGNSMSQARALFASSGSQTAAVVTGGRSSPGVEDPTNKTEEYDGTNWTSGGNYLISVKENTQGGGPQTAAYMAGGSAPPYTTVAGHYDGTAWATAASLPTVKGLGNAASNTADNTTGLVFGGAGPSTTNTTFDFTAETSAVNAKTLTTS